MTGFGEMFVTLVLVWTIGFMMGSYWMLEKVKKELIEAKQKKRSKGETRK